jgi:cardiolipin synthase
MSSNVLVRQIPNTLTTLRLLLALPLCWLILQREFEAVLWVALAAGVSDGLDGWLARQLDAASRYGAIVDPLADKLMLSGAYPSMAAIGLLPWWLALLVIGRDLVIVAGAMAYHGLYGSYDMSPSSWGKFSTFIQIVLVLALLVQQVYPALPPAALEVLLYIVAIASIWSGAHYVQVWGAKAIVQARE